MTWTPQTLIFCTLMLLYYGGAPDVRDWPPIAIMSPMLIYGATVLCMDAYKWLFRRFASDE